MNSLHIPFARAFVTVVLVIALYSSSIAQEAGVLESLKPIMNVPDEIAYQSDFAVAQELDKKQWQQRQGTQWKIADGVLRGEQSSEEYQAKKADHKGSDSRIKSLITPRQFIAKFSVRFIDGEETSLLPIVEFGHHNVRLKFSETGVVLLADHEIDNISLWSVQTGQARTWQSTRSRLPAHKAKAIEKKVKGKKKYAKKQ